MCIIGNSSGEIEWVGRVWERGSGGAGVAVHSIAHQWGWGFGCAVGNRWVNGVCVGGLGW